MFSVAGDRISARDLHDLLRLRVDVFVVEQECPYPEIDGRDLEPTTTHYWFADDAGPTATIRTLHDDAGRRIGRVATRLDARGQKLSSLLLEDILEREGHDTTVLDAQSHLRHFYERFGYVVCGPEFIEDGIPHLPMTRPGVAP